MNVYWAAERAGYPLSRYIIRAPHLFDAINALRHSREHGGLRFVAIKLARLEYALAWDAAQANGRVEIVRVPTDAAEEREDHGSNA